MRAAFITIVFSLMVGGCGTSSLVSSSRDVRVEGIVESFEPAAFVVYNFDFCAQFADTSLSHVRILSPLSLKDKVYAIDLGLSPDLKQVAGRFATVGKRVQFSLPRNLVDSKPEDLIPLSRLDEPNQSLEPTATSVTIPAGAGLAPAVTVAHH